MAGYSQPDTSAGKPRRLGDEGNSGLRPGRIDPEQADPLVVPQTDIFPIICRIATCRCFGGGTEGGLPASGHWTTGRADRRRLISYSPWAVASPPFPSALPAFHLHRKGGPVPPEREGTGGQGAGWGGGGRRDVLQASLHLITCTRGFQRSLCCVRLHRLKVCMEPAQMSSPYCSVSHTVAGVQTNRKKLTRRRLPQGWGLGFVLLTAVLSSA